MRVFFGLFLGLAWPSAYAAPIELNSVVVAQPPSWLARPKVERTVARVQKFLEWDIRKVQVSWYTDAETFRKAHGFDDSVLAFSLKSANTISIGPRVTSKDFESVFGHELVHIILFQKYQEAVPRWLEEGMANYISKHGAVDYKWLATQPHRPIRSLVHPFAAGAGAVTSADPPPSPRYHYQASTAVMEMIAGHCDIHSLLQLTVGEKLESYLGTLCQITDLDTEFAKWLQRKSRP